jgi:hypothetical protein
MVAHFFICLLAVVCVNTTMTLEEDVTMADAAAAAPAPANAGAKPADPNVIVLENGNITKKVRVVAGQLDHRAAGSPLFVMHGRSCAPARAKHPLLRALT